MKKLLKLLTSKIAIVTFFVILQVAIFASIVIFLRDTIPYFFTVSYAISIILVLFILKSDELLIYKLAWIVTIMIAPIFGGLFYIVFKPYNVTRRLANSAKIKLISRENITKDLMKPLPNIDEDFKKQITYLNNDHWPYYENTNATFLDSGEVKLKYVIEELKKATDFIFLEYFILDESGMIWEYIYPILVEKAKEGLDVRLIYDDFGSATRLKYNFKKRLENDGIKVVAFNPLKLRFVIAHNNRDHKKIIVIDGKTAFTGGVNIADEYINAKKRFGHWHDAAIMLKGDAVYSLTVSFLESWDSQTKENSDYSSFKSDYKEKKDGYIIPFSDSPHHRSFLSVNLYAQMIASAKKEIFIATPYFIVDENLINIIKLQALSGVKIHIVVPGTPDKRFAYVVTKYNLKQLASTKNIYIYSYTPGFVHSKLLYVDGKAVTVGTVNFDFRSFYLHFENTVLLYENSIIPNIKDYFDETIRLSKQLTYDDLHKRNIFYKMYETFLVIFSHLL